MIKTVKLDPFIFRGKVSEAGYEWVKGMDGKPRLVPRRIPGKGFRIYEPRLGLFREFAAVNPTRDAIRDFADTSGDLFSSYDVAHGVPRDDGTVSRGASLGTWTREVGDMRSLVDLWERIQHRQIAELENVVKWTDKAVGYVIKTPRRERRVTLAHADIPETGFGRFSPKDVVLPARCALQQEINLRLAEQPTIPRLAWTPDHHQRMIFTPPNLLAAMWLQFAQDVIGEFELYSCDGCGKFFQRGPGGRRADATTCSDACRQRKNRNEKAARS